MKKSVLVVCLCLVLSVLVVSFVSAVPEPWFKMAVDSFIIEPGIESGTAVENTIYLGMTSKVDAVSGETYYVDENGDKFYKFRRFNGPSFAISYDDEEESIYIAGAGEELISPPIGYNQKRVVAESLVVIELEDQPPYNFKKLKIVDSESVLPPFVPPTDPEADDYCEKNPGILLQRYSQAFIGNPEGEKSFWTTSTRCGGNEGDYSSSHAVKCSIFGECGGEKEGGSYASGYETYDTKKKIDENICERKSFPSHNTGVKYACSQFSDWWPITSAPGWSSAYLRQDFGTLTPMVFGKAVGNPFSEEPKIDAEIPTSMAVGDGSAGDIWHYAMLLDILPSPNNRGASQLIAIDKIGEAFAPNVYNKAGNLWSSEGGWVSEGIGIRVDAPYILENKEGQFFLGRTDSKNAASSTLIRLMRWKEDNYREGLQVVDSGGNMGTGQAYISKLGRLFTVDTIVGGGGRDDARSQVWIARDKCPREVYEIGSLHMKNVWAGGKWNKEQRSIEALWEKGDKDRTEMKSEKLNLLIGGGKCAPDIEFKITVEATTFWLGGKYMSGIKKALREKTEKLNILGEVADNLPKKGIYHIKIRIFKDKEGKMILNVEMKDKKGKVIWGTGNRPYGLKQIMEIMKGILDTEPSNDECKGILDGKDHPRKEREYIEERGGQKVEITEVACEATDKKGGWWWDGSKGLKGWWLAKKTQKFLDGTRIIEQWNYQGKRIKYDQMTWVKIKFDVAELVDKLECCPEIDQNVIDKIRQKLIVKNKKNSLYMVRDANNYSYNGIAYRFSPEFEFNKSVTREFDYSWFGDDVNPDHVFLITYDNESMLGSCNLQSISNQTFKMDSNGLSISVYGLDYFVPVGAVPQGALLNIEVLNLSECFCNDNIMNNGEQGVDCGGQCVTECAPSCEDNLDNGDEEGIDCGGSCVGTCYPDHCSNFVQDEDETGEDCGGSCALDSYEPCGRDYNRDCEIAECLDLEEEKISPLIYDWITKRLGLENLLKFIKGIFAG